tara:strand:- start:153 stop:557 length:405 start_codon:yes stop_codon:yes gene_type:complete
MTEETKKGPLQKLKDNITDKEEQLAIFTNFVRLGVLIWSGFILTLNYITIPGWQQNKIDPTFIASVFTGTLSLYGVEAAKKRGDGTFKAGDKPMNKKEIEQLIATQQQSYQWIRVETPLKILGAEVVNKKEDKK